jgi:hypothetical protein
MATDDAIAEFIERVPSLESNWRSVIQFGKNVASYKFALGKSLLELADAPDTFISLERLAEPFSRNLIEHIKGGRKQITSKGSKFLDALASLAQRPSNRVM